MPISAPRPNCPPSLTRVLALTITAALPTAAGTDVHVVVVTYNGEAWIRGCLESLAQSSTPVRSIVVDNASTDRTADTVEQEFPRTRITCSTKNLG